MPSASPGSRYVSYAHQQVIGIALRPIALGNTYFCHFRMGNTGLLQSENIHDRFGTWDIGEVGDVIFANNGIWYKTSSATSWYGWGYLQHVYPGAP